VKLAVSLVAALVLSMTASVTVNGKARTAVTIPPAPAFAPADLVPSAGADWATNGGNYGQTRYSSLSQVTTANVRRLRLKWHIHLNGSGTAAKYKGEGTPLVFQGIMYTVTGAGDVFAIDATTGTILWQSSAQLPAMTTVCCGWVSRGLALGDGKVYVARLDNTLAALSQQDGHVIWSTSNANWQDGYTMTMAPLYYNGLVVVGVSGGEFGARGSVTAYDARTGRRVWRFYTVPEPGQPGGNTWPADNSWRTGGAPVWNTPSVDPKTGLLYVTTGNAYPWSTRGPGDNLFTSSFLALNAMAGTYAWHYQVVHHDIWDYDCASNTVLFNTGIAGKVRKVVAEPCKTGWVYELDRRNGTPVSEIQEKPVPQNVFQNTSPTQPIPAGDSFSRQCAEPKSFPKVAFDGRPFRFGCIFSPFDQRAFTAVAPGAPGGNNWTPASYSPQTGNLYICSRNSQSAYRAVANASGSYSGGKLFVGVDLSFPTAGKITTGAFTAMSMARNKIVWQKRFTRTAFRQTDASCGSGSLATAGGLVFLGLPQGMYHGLAAYDARTGGRLWRVHTDAGIEAPPMTYSVGGEQYVAVFAGGRITHGTPALKGDDLYAFTLNGTGPPPSFAAARTTTNIDVSMTEYTFKLSASHSPVGRVAFRVKNDGLSPHNFAIAGQQTAELAPGASQTIIVNFTSPGPQPYLCTLPGHADAGMQGTFTITGSAGKAKPVAVLNATEKEWKIRLTTATGARVRSVRQGLVRFRIRNTGTIAHNFVIARHQSALLEPERRTTLNVMLKPGRYGYRCSVFGHAARGMRGVLVVRRS
jgi:quinohemoprotein ethanol dehydrogenase